MEMSFEQAMARLEEIVKILESSTESLDQSLKLFEEGTKLSAFCYGTLQQAEQKIKTLSLSEDEV